MSYKTFDERWISIMLKRGAISEETATSIRASLDVVGIFPQPTEFYLQLRIIELLEQLVRLERLRP